MAVLQNEVLQSNCEAGNENSSTEKCTFDKNIKQNHFSPMVLPQLIKMATAPKQGVVEQNRGWK